MPTEQEMQAAIAKAVADAVAKAGLKPKRAVGELTQAQKDLIAGLPETMRADVARSLVEANTKRDLVVAKNRSEFSAVKNAAGNIVIRGLGNRFPLGIRPDSLKIVLDHAEELRKLIV